MKKTILLLLFPLLSNISVAQEKEKAEKLVSEGINYHDKGDYEGALNKYIKALELDKDNLFALAEKATTYLAQEKYDNVIEVCKRAISAHPGESDLKNVYVAYGNALDGLKKTDESIKIYDAGLKVFPDYYQLHFNKGITLSSIKKYDEAILCFQKSVALNPKHAGSHNAIARMLDYQNKRIPSLLAYSRFLILEPTGKRAVGNLANAQVITNGSGNAEKTGRKSVTINLSPDMLADTTVDGKPKENSFTSTDLILTMSSALDFDKKYKKETEVEKFTRKMETVCSSLSETKKDNYGFYWNYYVPYFIELKEKGFLETFGYICFASSEDKAVAKWLKSHEKEVDEFYDWSKAFEWKSK